MNMHETIVRARLKECGYDIKSIVQSETVGKQITTKVLYVCKEGTSGKATLTGVPRTWLCFDGVICTIDQMMLLIDKSIACEWGILK